MPVNAPLAESRKNAYRLVLAAGMLHLKWDLAGCYDGFSWVRPWRFMRQCRSAIRAAQRSSAMHNLAIFASLDFEHFSEDQFWRDIDEFCRRYPDDVTANYRQLFDRCLNGEAVHIMAPSG